MGKITWTKKYEEDLGTKDEKGWYDYEYRYYTYWFTLPDNQKIRARSYTYQLEHCSIYVSLDNLDSKNDIQMLKLKAYIFAIINFLLTTQGIKTINYFNEAYKPVDLTAVINNLSDFVFEHSTNG